MSKTQMLINYVPNEECRIALVEDGRLEELYQERASIESHVGNIYKGRVTNVEPSIQAAFIEFGLERNGFLHISDLHPKHFPGKLREEFEKVGSKTPRRERPPIQKCLRRGDEVLVQVIKEGIGTKGPTLTSYLSIPGRFIVMMPDMQRLGVSRKIEDDDIRRKMRKTLDELKPPKGFGFIVRTAGIDRPKAELKRDLAYLQRLWKSIEDRKKNTVVGELYSESDLIVRTIRDVFSADIDRVVIDHPDAAQRAMDFLSVASPRSIDKVKVYKDSIPLFHRFDVESQIENSHARTVPMPSGAYLVFDSTEALVAIDVNSGKNRQARDAETNAFKVNSEAADEICRQLRLRDLGGVVVIDFIDMIAAKHRRAIEQRFRKNMKKDRARTRVGSISQFGMLELTRQRMRPSLKKSFYQDCPYCLGAGQVKKAESVLLDVMRRLAVALNRNKVAKVTVIVSPTVAFQLLNKKRHQLVQLEKQYDKPIMVRVNDGGSLDFLDLQLEDARGNPLDSDSVVKYTEPALEAVAAMEEIEDDQSDDEHEQRDEAYEKAADLMEKEASATDEDASAEDGATTSTDDKESDEAADESQTKKKRRRRRGGKRRSKSRAAKESADSETTPDTGEPDRAAKGAESSRESPADDAASEAASSPAADGGDGAGEDDQPRKKSRRRSRGGRRKSKSSKKAETASKSGDSESKANDSTSERTNDSQSDSGSKDEAHNAAEQTTDNDSQSKRKASVKRKSKQRKKKMPVSKTTADNATVTILSKGYSNKAEEPVGSKE